MAFTGEFDAELTKAAWFDELAVPFEWWDELNGARWVMPADTATFVFTGNVVNLIKPPVLVADTGVFTTTGVAVTFRIGHRLTAVVGTFTATGNATTFLNGKKLVAVVGTFVETGIATGLLRNRVLAATSRSFSLTGISAPLLRGYPLVATSRSFTETGSVTNLFVGHRLSATVGTFAETGIAAGLRFQHVLSAVTRTFVLVGSAAILSYGRRFQVSVGTFSSTGVNTGLLFGHKVITTVRTFTETGTVTALKLAHLLSISSGSFVLTGNTSVLTPPPFAVHAVVGAFSLSGVSASFRRTRVLAAVPAVFVLTGKDVHSPGLAPQVATIRAELRGFATILSNVKRFQIGDAATLPMTFADKLGPRDPSDFTITFRHFTKAGVLIDTTTKTMADSARDSKGVWHLNLAAFTSNDVGKWYFHVIATGDVEAGSRESSFVVDGPLV